MNKILTVALGAVLAAASASAVAADDNGAFFINAGVGQAQYHVGHTDGLGFHVDDKDTAGALRFGYAWRVAPAFDLGVEAGYANLGKLVAKFQDEEMLVKADVGAEHWLLGVNGKYRFQNHWYLSARGGWLHSEAKATSRVVTLSTGETVYGSIDGDGHGWYAGVGVGYDFAPNFSLGLNYDNYHAKAETADVWAKDNIGSFMFTAEYRF